MSLERTMNRQKQRPADALLRHAKAQPETTIEDVLSGSPGVIHMIMAHDDGCPAAHTHNGFDCTCEPDVSYHRES